jgi:TolA-binding protein
MPLRLLSLVLLLTFIPHLNQLGVSSASSAPQEKLLTVAIGAFNDKFYAFAEEQFRKYIESYPDSPDIDRVYYLLGRTSYLQGKTSKANEVFNKLVHEFPAFEEMGNALFWLGRTWFELGNDREAATYLKKLVFIHHENEHLSEAYYLLGYIHVQWKSFVEAEYYLRE